MAGEHPLGVTVGVRLPQFEGTVYEYLVAEQAELNGDTLYWLLEVPKHATHLRRWDLVRCEGRGQLVEVVDVVERDFRITAFAFVPFDEVCGPGRWDKEWQAAFTGQITGLGGRCEDDGWEHFVIYAPRTGDTAQRIADFLDNEEAKGTLRWTYLLTEGLDRPLSSPKVRRGVRVDPADYDTIHVYLLEMCTEIPADQAEVIINFLALIEYESLNAECDGKIDREFAFFIKVARDTRSWERITTWLDLRKAVGDLEWESDRPNMESLKDKVYRWLDEHADEYDGEDELVEEACDAFDVEVYESYGICAITAMEYLVSDWSA